MTDAAAEAERDLHTLEIVLGSALLSITDPFRGDEAEYNRWYERDHYFAGGTINPYVFSGARWVAPMRLKELRYCRPNNPINSVPRIGSYLHLYWILAGADRAWRERNSLVVGKLFGQGRMTGSKRDTVFTVNPALLWSRARDTDGVPVEMALEHRYPGLVFGLSSAADEHNPAAFAQWLRSTHAAHMMSAKSPAAVCATFDTRPLIFSQDLADQLGLNPTLAPPPQYLQLWFLDTPVEDAWDEWFRQMPEAVAASGLGRLEWLSPFQPAIPGTNRYIDQLW